MEEIIAELKVPESVKRELCRGFHARMNMAAIEQENVGRATAALGPQAPLEGVGQLMMRVHPTIYWRMKDIFGADCWKDPAFRRSYMEKNPGCRVPCKLRKTTVRVDGLRQRGKMGKGEATTGGIVIATR